MTFRPSTADSTDMAGVIIASPKKNAAPMMPMASTKPPFFLSSVSTSTTSERMPPSPLLSARIRKTTYLSVTMRISAQISSEATPRTAARRSPPADDHRMQGFAHGIERAGADVAEDDADRGEGQFERRLRGDGRDRCGLIVLLFHGSRPCRALLLLCSSAAIRPSRRRGIQQEGRSESRAGRAWAAWRWDRASAVFWHPGHIAHPVGQFLAAAGRRPWGAMAAGSCRWANPSGS